MHSAPCTRTHPVVSVDVALSRAISLEKIAYCSFEKLRDGSRGIERFGKFISCPCFNLNVTVFSDKNTRYSGQRLVLPSSFPLDRLEAKRDREPQLFSRKRLSKLRPIRSRQVAAGGGGAERLSASPRMAIERDETIRE